LILQQISNIRIYRCLISKYSTYEIIETAMFMQKFLYLYSQNVSHRSTVYRTLKTLSL